MERENEYNYKKDVIEGERKKKHKKKSTTIYQIYHGASIPFPRTPRLSSPSLEKCPSIKNISKKSINLYSTREKTRRHAKLPILAYLITSHFAYDTTERERERERESG